MIPVLDIPLFRSSMRFASKELDIRTSFTIVGGHEQGKSSGSPAYKSPNFPSIIFKISEAGTSVFNLMEAEAYFFR